MYTNYWFYNNIFTFEFFNICVGMTKFNKKFNIYIQ